jgi:hypothetical protein
MRSTETMPSQNTIKGINGVSCMNSKYAQRNYPKEPISSPSQMQMARIYASRSQATLANSTKDRNGCQPTATSGPIVPFRGLHASFRTAAIYALVKPGHGERCQNRSDSQLP